MYLLTEKTARRKPRVIQGKTQHAAVNQETGKRVSP